MTGAWLETEEDVIETRAQLHSRVEDVLEEGELSDERLDEVISALEAGTTTVDEVMVDVDDVVFLSTTDSVAENVDRLESAQYTRYPLVGETPEEFEGIVYVPAVVEHLEELRAGELSFADVAVPPMTVTADATVSDAVDQFQVEHQELALVFSEGNVVGLLTATDAFEAVMGNWRTRSTTRSKTRTWRAADRTTAGATPREPTTDGDGSQKRVTRRTALPTAPTSRKTPRTTHPRSRRRFSGVYPQPLSAPPRTVSQP